MGAGALTICHNKAAVQVKEDMKKLVQLPILRAQPAEVKGSRLFGVSLSKLCEQGLVTEGVPMAVRRMVEHLRIHALHQEGLFRVNGNVRAVETLKQRLENDEDVDFLSEADVCTVASLLKQYLRELPEGLVNSAIQAALLQQHQDSSCSDEGSWSDLRDLLQQLPDVHYSLLRYFCRFLTEVESHHQQNLMTALNLATVFGPSVFHVSPGFEAMKEQNVCNKVMARLIQNYGNIFESSNDGDRGGGTEEAPTLIIVKEVHPMNVDDKFSPKSPKMAVHAKKKQVRKGTSSPAGSPHVRQLPTLVPVALGPRSSSPVIEKMETPPLPSPPCSPSDGMEAYDRSPEDDRPISPFYMSNHLSPVHCRPDVANFLDRTIRAAVQQHLFDINSLEGHGSQDHELPLCNASPVATPNARQRRRRQREQEAESARGRERSRFTSLKTDIHQEKLPLGDKENSDNISESTSTVRVSSSHRGHSVHLERTAKPSKPRHDQDANAECPCVSGTQTRPGGTDMEALAARKESLTKNGLPAPQRLRMKIQESPVICDTGRSCSGEKVRGLDPECENRGDVPRLDLTALSEDNNNNNNWGDPSFFDSPFLDFKSIFQQSYCDEPVPAYSSWQRESMDREEARLSPHAGGRLIRQLMEEGNDPMLSPRFYGYGHSQQYLNDTEVPPSPPNAHSFASRRRSSSLGSCDDEKEELSSAQLSKRIHVLKKKIHRFEEKFEDDRKYRPSHSDKLANPEVLRWVNELAKLRKNLKEHKLLKSEEDLPPLTRQRSNTLPKSFGSQLEKKHQPEKTPLPPAESTLEVVLDKLQEKRAEVGRPEDIKDMTREQIGAEKLALQKALLYYESIHGRPVTKSERQIMKPLYDRYRLVKQILCRASTIPVIGSPSSKRRGPLLQPIIEGVPALFFDDIKEEEDGPEEEGESIPQFTVTDRPNLSMLSFLDQMEEEADGFISPVDELSPSKNTIDMRLSNLHSATMQELVEQLQETREEKKRLRKNLREFEDQFFRENGRNVQKEDRSPLAVEYNEYKHVKAKLRLLEVLISKRDSTKFI